MRRRDFITLIAGCAGGWPRLGGAQQAAGPVIGFLGAESPELFASRLRAFHQGLAQMGYVEGRDLSVEYRWAKGHNDRLPPLAQDLVQRQVRVIVAGGTPAALAAKAATASIAIVASVAVDPLAVGLVAGFAEPGGNVTAVTTLGAEIGPKQLEILHELVPGATVALLLNPTNPAMADTEARKLFTAAGMLGLQLRVTEASSEAEFARAFAAMRGIRADALIIGNDLLFNSRLGELADLALRNAIPAMHQYREFAAAGGLMSFGGSVAEVYRRNGIYTARILKGEKPADLPVQQATEVELVLNLRTAKALGLTVPPTLLARADEIIE
ncbi:MAG TPA: ABC transporter substrate-binding protein [Xanthobacteraceae bacterium]|jgi:putative ABC transport system substrate-binding protein